MTQHRFPRYSHAMRRNVCWKMACIAMSVVSLSIGGKVAVAQSTTTKYWQQVQQTDAKMKAVKLSWQVSVSLLPKPMRGTEEEQVEKVRLRGLHAGMKPAAIEADVKSARFNFQAKKLGAKTTEDLTCIRVQNEMRGDRIGRPLYVTGEAPETSRSYSLDYFDGENGVTLMGPGTMPPAMGEVVKSPDMILSNSAPSLEGRIMLFAAPVTTIFSPDSSKISDAGDDALTLEKRSVEDGHPMIYRATLSKMSWRPTKIQCFSAERGNLLQESVADDFHVYGNNIQLPSHVRITLSGVEVDDYALRAAQVNDKVNPMDVKVTHAPTIVDCRFDDCVTYKWTSGVLPDKDKVAKIRAGAVSPPNTYGRPGTNIPIYAPVVGLFLACLSIGLWGYGMRVTKQRRK